jgi:hypothetical protein
MHDPMILAHEIKYPWWHHKPWPKAARKDPEPFALKRRWKELTNEQQECRSNHWPEGYRNTFITIWHVDPERDGSDDSCGWSWPKITKKQREVLRNTAWWEGQHTHFLCCNEKEWNGTIQEAECLHRGMVALVNRVLNLGLSMDQMTRYSVEAIHVRCVGKAGDVFCFLAGYHTNNKTDSKDDRADHFHGILCNVARGLLDLKRPWYRHPKWHFWHWQFQCHPLLQLKRVLFSRCCKCGGMFHWNESCTSGQWNSTGPRWFRGEEHLSCEKCSGGVSDAKAETKAA